MKISRTKITYLVIPQLLR